MVENGAFRLGVYPVCHPTADEAYGFRLESRGDSVFFSGDTLPGCEGVLRGGRESTYLSTRLRVVKSLAKYVDYMAIALRYKPWRRQRRRGQVW